MLASAGTDFGVEIGSFDTWLPADEVLASPVAAGGGRHERRQPSLLRAGWPSSGRSPRVEPTRTPGTRFAAPRPPERAHKKHPAVPARLRL